MSEKRYVAVPLDKVACEKRVAAPWSQEESLERFNQSLQNGHHQLYLKCQHCSLEFMMLTLRTPTEAVAAYQGDPGDFAANVTCPECGVRGQSFWLGTRQSRGPISQFVGEFGYPA